MPASVCAGRVTSASIVAAVLLLACPRAEAAPTTREAFIARHRCEITARLDEIHRRGPVTTSRDRFITLSLRDPPQHYVQCIFTDRDTAMFCEASSGAYRSADDRDPPLRLSPSSLAALHVLGYRQDDRSKNYAREIQLGSPPDTARAAELMLMALFDAYGARPDSVIAINAPRGGLAGIGCGTPAS